MATVAAAFCPDTGVLASGVVASLLASVRPASRTPGAVPVEDRRAPSLTARRRVGAVRTGDRQPQWQTGARIRLNVVSPLAPNSGDGREPVMGDGPPDTTRHLSGGRESSSWAPALGPIHRRCAARNTAGLPGPTGEGTPDPVAKRMPGDAC